LVWGYILITRYLPYHSVELNGISFKFDDLTDLLGDEVAVCQALISVVILISHMDDKLRTLGVSTEGHCIHLEQVDLPIDL